MAVREFDAVDDTLIVDNGVLGNVSATGVTLLAVFKPVNVVSSPTSPILVGAIGSTDAVSVCYQNNNIQYADQNDFDAIGGTGLVSTAYQIVALTKASGSGVWRAHRKTLGSGSWFHQDGPLSVSINSGTWTDVRFGSFASGSAGVMDGRIAVAAVWDSVLTDLQLEAIETAATTAYIASLSPSGLWDFNQPNTTTKVFDLSGNGAHETSITGTTVVTGDDPAWTFGLTSFPTLPVIDNFNRANEAALAAPWAGPLYSGEGQLGLTSNTCDGSNGNGYYTTTFGPDCEAYFTIPRKPTDGNSTSVFARIDSPGNSSIDGYAVRATASAGTDGVEIYRIDNETNVLLGGSGVNLEIVNGDALGISCVGSTIRSWYKPVSGEWAPLQTVTDSTYSAAGYLAMEAASNSIDDFGGGTITGEAPPTGPTIISTIQMRSGRW